VALDVNVESNVLMELISKVESERNVIDTKFIENAAGE